MVIIENTIAVKSYYLIQFKNMQLLLNKATKISIKQSFKDFG